MQLAQLIENHLAYLTRQNLSPHTIKNRRSHLRRFLVHLEVYGVGDVERLHREVIEDYLDALSWEPTHRGVPMSVQSRNVRLVTLRGFTRWLVNNDIIVVDPAADIRRAIEPTTLPRDVLSETQVLRLIDVPDRQTPLGYRDRALIEMLYATGLRVRELVALNIGHVDVETALVIVRQGKGQKDRVVPLGRRAASTTASYIDGVRGELVSGTEPALWVNYRGTRLSPEAVTRRIKAYGEAIGVKVTAHGLRHACASHMMRRGAHLRHVQELLGHAAITTTEIYTRLTRTELVASHARYHPREQTPAQ